jgi:hypothetical protein
VSWQVGENTEWAVATTTPTGVEYDPQSGVNYAADAVNCINDAAGRRVAGLARRLVIVGGWMDNTDGNAWGCRHEWPDGHVEYESALDRACAAERAEMPPPGASSTVASRWVVHSSEWTLIAPELAL